MHNDQQIRCEDVPVTKRIFWEEWQKFDRHEWANQNYTFDKHFRKSVKLKQTELKISARIEVNRKECLWYKRIKTTMLTKDGIIRIAKRLTISAINCWNNSGLSWLDSYVRQAYWRSIEVIICEIDVTNVNHKCGNIISRGVDRLNLVLLFFAKFCVMRPLWIVM